MKLKKRELLVQTLSSLSGCSRIQVVSINPREGTTTVTLALAEALSIHTGASVIVVDANIQSPRLHKQFRLAGSLGLLDFIEDPKLELEEIVQSSGMGFDVIVAGCSGEGKLTQLTGKGCEALATRLEHRYDYVLFDTPPITRFPGIDKMISYFQGIVLVVECGKTRWEVAMNMKERLEMAKANICGVIMNKRRFEIPRWLYRYV